MFPEPYMLVTDGGFHKRKCFIWPDIADELPGWNRFNYSTSRGRIIIENGIGLFKMKFRRFHKHQIAELTDIIPDLIMCACVLHNICIDAGDVNRDETNARNDDDEEDRTAIRNAFNRVMTTPQVSMSTNASVLVQEARFKRESIFNYWISYNLDPNVPHDIDYIKEVFGEDAFLPFF
jgi:hypothetical protein